MSFQEEPNVLKLLKKYQRKYPTASRPMLTTFVRLEYENQYLRQYKIIDIRRKVAALKKLDRALDKIFPNREASSKVIKVNKGMYDFPVIDFEITQGKNAQRRLPSVGFNIANLNNYPVKLRVEARVFLGGNDRGLVQDVKGYYNGKTEWPLDPFQGLMNGNFSIERDCVGSDKELTIEVKVAAIDPSSKEHKLSPRSWTYIPANNTWFYEPRAFSK